MNTCTAVHKPNGYHARDCSCDAYQEERVSYSSKLFKDGFILRELQCSGDYHEGVNLFG